MDDVPVWNLFLQSWEPLLLIQKIISWRHLLIKTSRVEMLSNSHPYSREKKTAGKHLVRLFHKAWKSLNGMWSSFVISLPRCLEIQFQCQKINAATSKPNSAVTLFRKHANYITKSVIILWIEFLIIIMSWRGRSRYTGSIQHNAVTNLRSI